jgi:hypothetical protein
LSRASALAPQASNRGRKFSSENSIVVIYAEVWNSFLLAKNAEFCRNISD